MPGVDLDDPAGVLAVIRGRWCTTTPPPTSPSTAARADQACADFVQTLESARD